MAPIWGMIGPLGNSRALVRVWLFSSYKLESTRPCKDFFSKQETFNHYAKKLLAFTLSCETSQLFFSTSHQNFSKHIKNIPKQPRNKGVVLPWSSHPKHPQTFHWLNPPDHPKQHCWKYRGGTWRRFSVSYGSGGGYVRTGRNNTHRKNRKNCSQKWPFFKREGDGCDHFFHFWFGVGDIHQPMVHWCFGGVVWMGSLYGFRDWDASG